MAKKVHSVKKAKPTTYAKKTVSSTIRQTLTRPKRAWTKLHRKTLLTAIEGIISDASYAVVDVHTCQPQAETKSGEVNCC